MNSLVSFLPLFIAMGVFMFLGARRQRKAMQATIDLHESLQVGDRVQTTSGLYGTITGITDDAVDIEIAPGVVTNWTKLAIRDRIAPAVPGIDDARMATLTDDDADRLTRD